MMRNTLPTSHLHFRSSTLSQSGFILFSCLYFFHSVWLSTSFFFPFSLFLICFPSSPIHLLALNRLSSFYHSSILLLLISVSFKWLVHHHSHSIFQTDRILLKSGGLMCLPSVFHHLLLCFLSVAIYFSLPHSLYSMLMPLNLRKFIVWCCC